ncbi:MAG: PAS domain S-box protein, partial [Nitrospirota bacterium]
DFHDGAKTHEGKKLPPVKKEKDLVLIVDDDPAVLALACEILEKWNYEVICCTRAEDALEELKKQDVDLLIGDLVMPEMDGLALLKKAREIVPDLICVIMTGHGTIQIAVEAMKMGAFDFIIKPLDLKVFKYAVTRASEVRQLHKLKEVYRSIVEDYQTEFILRFLPDMTITFVNDAFCRHLSKGREQLLGQSFLQFTADEDKDYVRQLISQIHDTNPIVILEHRIYGYSGEANWQRLIVRGMFDKQGNLTENQAVGYDITEQKRTAEKLVESERKLRNVIEHSNELFYIRDNAHRFTYVSPQCAQILGYAPDELTAEWTNLLTENPINDPGLELTESALKKGEKQRPYLLEVYKKDKSKAILEIDESPLKDEKGEVIGIVGAARDVTAQKSAEKEIKKRMKDLEDFYEMAVAREMRMKELKGRIKELQEELAKYKELDDRIE